MPTCGNCGEANPERTTFCARCGAPLNDPADATRKVVTSIFTDVSGSTKLSERVDPEVLREVIGRYFQAAATMIRRHGGTVEKFAGDGVMAMFGVPVAHEDDALRAVCAAVDLREALASLNERSQVEHRVTLTVRTGINTGEVVVADSADGETFATGTPIIMAKRLEECAGGGDILIGPETYRLVRDAVVAEPVEGLPLKGVQAPLTAYRLHELRQRARDRPRRRLDTPMVGRDRERRLLAEAFELAVSHESCQLFTVLGVAGVGKTRLVESFLETLDEEATVLRGHCLSYGDGITFWPLAEAVRQATALDADDEPDAAFRKLAALLEGEPRAEEAAAHVAQLVGLAEPAAPASEGFWAVGALLEAIARQRPLILVLDDLHWAEPLFVDLVEAVARRAQGAAILIVCIARPQFLESHPSWGAGLSRSLTVTLEPLAEAAADELLTHLTGLQTIADGVRRRIKAAAGGNPLFLEEMLTMLADEGALEEERDATALRIPPTIQALLRARLDQLDPDERRLLSSAAVEGSVFHLEAAAALVPDALRSRVEDLLLELARKDILRPDRAAFSGDRAFRFRHVLIREAAYDATPKRLRAELHERLAEWLAQRAGDGLPEWYDIVGYHLEQAWRYRSELRLEDERTRSLAARAGERLVAAGRRAFALADMPAATTLFARGIALLPVGSPDRLAPLPDLAWAYRETGQFDAAEATIDEALTSARAAGDAGVEARARVERLLVRQLTQPQGWASEARREIDPLLETFRRLGDERGLAQVLAVEAGTHWIRCEFGAASRASQQALEHARQAHDAHLEAELRMAVQAADVIGPTHVDEGARRCEQSLASAGNHVELEAGTLLQLAVFRAMQGRFPEARELLERARPLIATLGTMTWIAADAEMAAWVELLAGDLVAAEERELPAYGLLRERGEQAWLATHAATLARIRLEVGRGDEAEALTRESERYAASDDRHANVVWRTVRAKVLAERHDADAERLAREAVEIAATTDSLDTHANALLALADVLEAGGRTEEAAPVLDEALALFERKGNSVSAARTRARRAAPAVA